MNPETILYQLTETSEFMMSSVIVTKENNCIVIDGGNPEDMPLLKEYIGKRHISMWILTHAHSDHISGFIDEYRKNGLADFDIERVVYNFPPYEKWSKLEHTPCHEFFVMDIHETLPDFLSIREGLGERAYEVKQGERLAVDECTIDFLYTWHEGLYENPMNDSSLVFKITTPNKSVLFLGDLGPAGGDVLFEESRHLLKSDIVQMAHHGHMNVGLEVYATILPEACIWCAPMWLYNEPELPPYLANPEKRKKNHRTRMFGTALTRKWMALLGVRTHYVTGEGTQTILL
ncbi:MAG: MBL fold metallo-hydrolase [Clostridia bacterium]|nr:MBL fold metallo-hydrolase [Clostridia bacterium]